MGVGRSGEPVWGWGCRRRIASLRGVRVAIGRRRMLRYTEIGRELVQKGQCPGRRYRRASSWRARRRRARARGRRRRGEVLGRPTPATSASPVPHAAMGCGNTADTGAALNPAFGKRIVDRRDREQRDRRRDYEHEGHSSGSPPRWRLPARRRPPLAPRACGGLTPLRDSGFLPPAAPNLIERTGKHHSANPNSTPVSSPCVRHRGVRGTPCAPGHPRCRPTRRRDRRNTENTGCGRAAASSACPRTRSRGKSRDARPRAAGPARGCRRRSPGPMQPRGRCGPLRPAGGVRRHPVTAEGTSDAAGLARPRFAGAVRRHPVTSEGLPTRVGAVCGSVATPRRPNRRTRRRRPRPSKRSGPTFARSGPRRPPQRCGSRGTRTAARERAGCAAQHGWSMWSGWKRTAPSTCGSKRSRRPRSALFGLVGSHSSRPSRR